MKRVIVISAISLTFAAGVSNNANAALANNAILNFYDGVWGCLIPGDTYPNCQYDATTVSSGSYFGIDTEPYDGVAVIKETDLVAIEAGVDGGIVLGSVQGPGDIDAKWDFFGALGSHTQAGTLSIASDDGAGNVTLDMTGWNIFWNGGDIKLDWLDTHYSTITCGNTCESGDTFILDYDNFYLAAGGFPSLELYTLHLSGTISAVPVPAAVWLFGSGLIGLIGIARRKKS